MGTMTVCEPSKLERAIELESEPSKIRNVFPFILLYFTDELKVCKFLTRSSKLQFNLLWAGVTKNLLKMIYIYK